MSGNDRGRNEIDGVELSNRNEWSKNFFMTVKKIWMMVNISSKISVFRDFGQVFEGLHMLGRHHHFGSLLTNFEPIFIILNTSISLNSLVLNFVPEILTLDSSPHEFLLLKTHLVCAMLN